MLPRDQRRQSRKMSIGGDWRCWWRQFRSTRRVAVSPLFRRRVLNENGDYRGRQISWLWGRQEGARRAGKGCGVCVHSGKRDLSMFSAGGEKLVGRDFRWKTHWTPFICTLGRKGQPWSRVPVSVTDLSWVSFICKGRLLIPTVMETTDRKCDQLSAMS